MSGERVLVATTVNGTRQERAVEPRMLLSDFLRHELGLTGTHVGCEHGVCGACTILLDELPVRSCLMFAAQAAGEEIDEPLSDVHASADYRRDLARVLGRRALAEAAARAA